MGYYMKIRVVRPNNQCFPRAVCTKTKVYKLTADSHGSVPKQPKVSNHVEPCIVHVLLTSGISKQTQWY